MRRDTSTSGPRPPVSKLAYRISDAQRSKTWPYCSETISLASVDDLQETLACALKKAQAVLCQYLEPDGPNENQTVKRLFGILNDPEVIRALEDSERPRGRRTARRQPAAL